MGRIVALDYGTVRIGVAISDKQQLIARALGTLPNKSDFPKQLEHLIKSEGDVDKIIVGLPLKLSGQDSAMTETVREFAKKLEDAAERPVELWDERLSSALVERSLSDAGVSRKKRSQLSDTLSAVVILQSYLDKKDL